MWGVGLGVFFAMPEDPALGSYLECLGGVGVVFVFKETVAAQNGLSKVGPLDSGWAGLLPHAF